MSRGSHQVTERLPGPRWRCWFFILMTKANSSVNTQQTWWRHAICIQYVHMVMTLRLNNELMTETFTLNKWIQNRKFLCWCLTRKPMCVSWLSQVYTTEYLCFCDLWDPVLRGQRFRGHDKYVCTSLCSCTCSSCTMRTCCRQRLGSRKCPETQTQTLVLTFRTSGTCQEHVRNTSTRQEHVRNTSGTCHVRIQFRSESSYRGKCKM